MSAARSTRREMPAAERAKLLAHFQGRIAARAASDPTTPYRALFQLANPAHIHPTFSIKDGVVEGLADYHERLRRCYALRAWCAMQIAHLSGGGWPGTAYVALCAARTHRRLARMAGR